MISPRTPSAAQPASSASVPRRTSSYVLVISRQAAAGRSGPRIWAASASVAGSRCGASNRTSVRRSSRSSVSARRRSPGLRGRNPSKQKRSVGSPDSASAVVTADGPGTLVTGMPAATAAATSR